jgi:hypothetical protein
MYIDCFDMTDAALANADMGNLNAMGVPSTQLQFYPMSNGVAALVQSISQIATTATIDALRIWGHGAPGDQGVSSGENDTDDSDWSGISAANFAQTAGLLGTLTPLFKSAAWAELRGCSVGADGAGRALLLDLASLWNVKVYGGEIVQAGPDWAPPVICADPGGGLSSTDGPELNLS